MYHQGRGYYVQEEPPTPIELYICPKTSTKLFVSTFLSVNEFRWLARAAPFLFHWAIRIDNDIYELASSPTVGFSSDSQSTRHKKTKHAVNPTDFAEWKDRRGTHVERLSILGYTTLSIRRVDQEATRIWNMYNREYHAWFQNCQQFVSDFLRAISLDERDPSITQEMYDRIENLPDIYFCNIVVWLSSVIPLILSPLLPREKRTAGYLKTLNPALLMIMNQLLDSYMRDFKLDVISLARRELRLSPEAVNDLLLDVICKTNVRSARDVYEVGLELERDEAKLLRIMSQVGLPDGLIPESEIPRPARPQPYPLQNYDSYNKKGSSYSTHSSSVSSIFDSSSRNRSYASSANSSYYDDPPQDTRYDVEYGDYDDRGYDESQHAYIEYDYERDDNAYYDYGSNSSSCYQDHDRGKSKEYVYRHDRRSDSRY